MLKIAQNSIGRQALVAVMVSELVAMLLLFTFLVSATGSPHIFSGMIVEIGMANFVVFILSTLLLAYFLGEKAGANVLAKKGNYYLAGYFLGLKVVVLSSLMSSIFAIALSLFTGELSLDLLIIYLFKPLIWLLPFGIVPIMIAGTWFGYQLRERRIFN
jgi:hypothetical protein